VDWPEGHTEPYHLYLAFFKSTPTAQRYLQLSRGRFAIEQFFRRVKTDLGLDHYEGRSWQGFHHHLVLAAVAYLFVPVIYLRPKKTSGVTWAQVLHAMRPWLVRLIGRGPCCGETFKSKFNDST